jgi:predicted component of type VI protein secretion system
MREIE